MKTQNKVQLIGYLGKDPLMSIAINGSKRAYLRMATDWYRKKKDGTVLKRTTWHDIVAWDKKAELVENELVTGSHIMVEGEIEYHRFLKNGLRRYITQIRAYAIIDLDR